MVKCSAYLCESRTYRNILGLTFHRLPKDQTLCDIWVSNMKIKSWKPSKTCVLCSKHFEEHFIDKSPFRTRLRPNTVPTLFEILPDSSERRLSEMRERRMFKVPRPSCRAPTQYDPEAAAQHFQVTVNVLEARKLAWSNPQSTNSYVLVVLGRKKHRTNIVRNMEEPRYREFLEFDVYMSIREIQRSSLWLAVMEPKCCAPPKILGEVTINLDAVWSQPNHQLYQKWAQLSLPRNPQATGPVGFLKVDISIVYRGEIQAMPAIVSNTKVDDNMILPAASEQQKANYIVTVHAAYNLPSCVQAHCDRRYGKPPCTYVRVIFCGLVAKTAVQFRTNDPQYSEQISMVEMFPNVNQVIRFEVCSAELNKVLASTELKLEDVSHDGENGFLPTFGPSLLHMYGQSASSSLTGFPNDERPYHKGSLLVSLKTVVPYYQQAFRMVTVEPVAPLQTETLWVHEDFCVFCPVFEVSMLDHEVVDKFSGIAITMGEVPCDTKMDEEFYSMMTELKVRKRHYTGSLQVSKSRPAQAQGCIEFLHEFPVLQLATRFPDFRFRMYRNNVVYGIVTDLEHVLQDVERRLGEFDYTNPGELLDDLNKAVDDAAGNILKYMDIIQYSSNSSCSEESLQNYTTELDARQLSLQKEEIENIYNQITRKAKVDSTMNLFQKSSKLGPRDSLMGSRKGVKLMLAEIKSLAQSLKNTVSKVAGGWPDIVVWLLNEGSRTAFTRISPADVIYSVIPEQCGCQCGRIQTIFMKPIKCAKHSTTGVTQCNCITGKVELMLWMGLFRHRHAFNNYMPLGYALKLRSYDMSIKCSLMMVECKAYIYRAKLTNGGGDSLNSVFNPFVRIHAFTDCKDSEVQVKTCTPTWNQVLKIKKMLLMSPERMANDPPFVLVEVFDDVMKGKNDLIGRVQIQPSVENRSNYAPKLQWYDIYKGTQFAGQILMSAQVMQVPEKLLKTTCYTPVQESFHASIKDSDDGDDYESLPAEIIPKSTTYKVDIYWWGLRDLMITRKPCIVLEIDDLLIKSDIIVDKKSNSNFPNGRTTQIFESPLNDDYTPNLAVKLYDNSTFGRTLYLGTNIIKNPTKYIIDWLPKNEREASLRSVSIVSSDFQEVAGQMLYVKKSSKMADDAEEFSNNVCVRNLNTSPVVYNVKLKKTTWKSIFCRESATDEEITLLPVYAKENNQIKVVKKIPKPAESSDWWMRYFQSEKQNVFEEEKIGNEHYITIYDYELEYQPEFSKFKDWCSTVKLYNGKKTGIPEKDEQMQCGYLKAGIAIYKWPPPENTVAVSLHGVELDKGYFEDHPENNQTKYLIRVYVIKALNLPKDFTGKINPYVVMTCGKKRLEDRMNFITNSTEPIFGKMYEFGCTLPEDYLLTVSLYDYDPLPPDELIGTTKIDLEDRVYTKHRAKVGLAAEYNQMGPSRWRDIKKPSAILEEICAKNHVPSPIFPDPYSVIVNGVEYRDCAIGRCSDSYATAAEHKENICLSILHKWQTLPLCGYHLVPEHVETRSLYHPEKPGLERGKIQLWVDIFPLDFSSYIPPPCDITPRKVEEYELRVIVWDAHSLIISSNKKKLWRSADLYVKSWIGSVDRAQQTDVHYNSVSGEGNFNWRMVFHFLYHPAERKIINKEKGPFTEYEEFVAPTLEVQLIESNEDEFLGSMTLNLNNMYRGAKLAQDCTLRGMEAGKKINLFSLRSIRAWWPLKTLDSMSQEDSTAGFIDLELTLLPRETATLMPVGVGRESPSPLPEPARRTLTFISRMEESKKKYFGRSSICHDFLASRGREILIFFVIITVVWFISYILYLYLPPSENFSAFRNNKINHRKNIGGIVRTLCPLRL